MSSTGPKYRGFPCQRKSLVGGVSVWCPAPLRVAIVFVGRATCYKDSYKWFEDIAKRYDVHFYCSLNSDIEPYEDFINMYGIKKHNFEKYEHQENVPDVLKGESMHKMSMFYNIKKGVGLIPDDEYDIIMYARTDMIYQQPIELSLGSDNDIYIPSEWDWGGINDQMCYGAPRAMKLYASLYDNLDIYERDIYGGRNPEWWLKCHVEHVGLSVNRFDLKYYLNAKRQLPI